MSTKRCLLCRRHLNQPRDPLSQDCGGDCWGCVSAMECPPNVPLDEYRKNPNKYQVGKDVK